MKITATTESKNAALEKDFFVHQHRGASLDEKLRQSPRPIGHSQLNIKDPEYQSLIEKLISGEFDYFEVEQRYASPTDRFGVVQGVISKLEKDSGEDKEHFSKVYQSFSPLMKTAIKNAAYLKVAIQPLFLDVFLPEVDYVKEIELF